MDKKRLVVCAMFENAAPDLLEWLAYHYLVGVEHFVLYDNGSTDDPARAIRGSPMAEHVTLIHWPQRPGQVAAYRHFIDIFAPGFEWAAFLDPDEFLLPLNRGNVVDALEWLSNASAVLVHRRVFGPGAWQEQPPGLVIENYDRRAADDFPANRQVRAILRCNELLDVTQNPHEFRINGPVFNAAGYLAPNTAMQEQPCYQNLVINHYYARSRPDALAKLQRANATTDATTNSIPPENATGLSDRLAALSRVHDTTIQGFAPAVRRLLGLMPGAGDTNLSDASDAMAGAGLPSTALPLTSTEVVDADPGRPDGSGRAGVSWPKADDTGSAPTPLPEATTPVTAVAASAMPGSGMPPGAQPGPPSTAAAAASLPVEVAPGWLGRGQDAQERSGGLALVFRDRSRPGDHWLAALRGAAVAAIDPAFVIDEFDRIRSFPTDAEARAACDAALAEGPGH